ncbi:MAG TPA: DUF2922 domain-containing protein [Lactobacillus sp.]|nr:DUF2922 domain-containing protein [Lactobacillus sp.]
MKELSLKFKNSAGKASHLKLRLVSEDLTEATVRAAMKDIAEANMVVDKDNHLSYVTPLSAQYIDTVNTTIFDDEPAKKPHAPKAPASPETPVAPAPQA